MTFLTDCIFCLISLSPDRNKGCRHAVTVADSGYAGRGGGRARLLEISNINIDVQHRYSQYSEKEKDFKTLMDGQFG